VIGDFNTLNDKDVLLVGIQNLSEPNQPLSQVMFFVQIKDGRISFWKVLLAFQGVSDK